MSQTSYNTNNIKNQDPKHPQQYSQDMKPYSERSVNQTAFPPQPPLYNDILKGEPKGTADQYYAPEQYQQPGPLQAVNDRDQQLKEHHWKGKAAGAAAGFLFGRRFMHSRVLGAGAGAFAGDFVEKRVERRR